MALRRRCDESSPQGEGRELSKRQRVWDLHFYRRSIVYFLCFFVFFIVLFVVRVDVRGGGFVHDVAFGRWSGFRSGGALI